MKKIVTFVSFFFLFGVCDVSAQIFWVENFESGSSSGTLAGAYGGWTTVSTGTNGSFPNAWYVSCAENGHTTGVCGTGCAATSATATLATLHIGSHSSFGGDLGASYFASSFSETNQRAVSPTINCTGKTNITLGFYYIENGDATLDDGTVWYSPDNGTSWSALTNPAKTTVCGGGQGQWGYYSVLLPTSANNNPTVKIGFQWTNNNDASGTDPSYAIDSVTLRTPSSGGPVVASMTASATSVCRDSCLTFTNTSTGTVDSFRWKCPTATIAAAGTSPTAICFTVSGTQVVKLYLYNGGVKVDSASTTITVNPAPTPHITKTGTTLSVPAVYTGYQWYVVGLPPTAITGATNATYTYSVGGTYGVVVDSAGCKGVAYLNTLGLVNITGSDNAFWLTQADGNSLVLYTALPMNERIDVDIYDATGRKIYNEGWEQGSTAKQINGLTLPDGLYIVRISNANTAAVLKWLKQ